MILRKIDLNVISKASLYMYKIFSQKMYPAWTRNNNFS